jgi:hypothetical protein
MNMSQSKLFKPIQQPSIQHDSIHFVKAERKPIISLNMPPQGGKLYDRPLPQLRTSKAMFETAKRFRPKPNETPGPVYHINL